ncbi:MAG TPA: PHP domain-containing protein [Candidatus Thermoplasmatota archaeon]|nr:PHP domain-containing protein [Candidatus Thermoplasmatota archaeon]
MRRRVDLHTHSTASDGTLAPAALARAAADAGLAAFALTDHDTAAGLAEAADAAGAAGVELVPGLELSLDAGPGEMHLLAYFVDPDEPRLARALEALRRGREARVPRIVARLAAEGVELTVEDVMREAGGAESLGRPHVARALVARGHVATVAEAFDRYLAVGRPGHVRKPELRPDEAIRLVRGAGGVAVLAHPFTIPEAWRERAVRGLARLGLEGLEIEYPKHDAALRATLAGWAKELDLVATGGSDFHGTSKPDIALGTGRAGNVSVDAAALDALKERRP